MSECVTPMNGSAGGVLDTSTLFQEASPAFVAIMRLVVSLLQRTIVPGARPTRGSGFGGNSDIDADKPDDALLSAAHAARETNPVASTAVTNRRECCICIVLRV